MRSVRDCINISSYLQRICASMPGASSSNTRPIEEVNGQTTYNSMYPVQAVLVLSHPLRKLNVEDRAQLAEQSHYSSRAIRKRVEALLMAVVAILLFASLSRNASMAVGCVD